MKHHPIFRRRYTSLALWLVLGVMSAQAQTNSAPVTNNAAAKPDEKNRAALKVDQKAYKARWRAALSFIQTSPQNWDAFEKAARDLIKDFPTKPNGYQDMMILIEHY